MSEVLVTYRVPASTAELQGVKFYVEFEDEREMAEVLGPGASREYKYYSGNLALLVDRGGGEPVREGLYSIPALFREAFGTRLGALGAEPAERRSRADIVLCIGLHKFHLDLVDRKWKAEMSYEARVVRGEKTLAAQTISGEAERLKIIGLKQADQVVGELFTDVVNRLDLTGILRRSGLPERHRDG